MSVVQNPLIGRARQKLGGTVFSTWKGINVIKGKPLTVANPRTDAQLQQRSALSQMVALGRSIYAAIFRGFNEQAVRKSQFNAFTGYNLRNAFDMAAPPVAALLWADLLVAQGTISETAVLSVVGSQAGGDVDVTWQTGTPSPGQSNTDIVQVVLVDPATKDSEAFTTGAIRSAGTINLVPSKVIINSGQTYHAYVFFYNTTTRKASTSVHVQFVAGA